MTINKQPPSYWEEEGEIEENSKLKCPYCGQWLGIMTNKNTLTVRCDNCGKKPILEINTIKPMECNIGLEEK